jgi:hypothetical protein
LQDEEEEPFNRRVQARDRQDARAAAEAAHQNFAYSMCCRVSLQDEDD